MKAIKDKYAEDKQRQQQEIMKFYKENKINPLGLLPALRPAAAGVHLALLHAADRPEVRHLRPAAARALHAGTAPPDHVEQPDPRKGRPCHGPHGRGADRNRLQRRLSGLGQIPVHPGHHRQGDRRGPDRADRPLHRLADRLDADGDRLGRSQPAPHDAGAAAGDRRVPVPLPRRPAGVLDHDERVDDRPAVLHPPPHRARRRRRKRTERR